MYEKKINKNILFYIFIFCFLLLFTVSFNTIDMDYWARILQGNAFLELGHILKSDPFSYVQTHQWLDHEWGSSVIFAFINKYFGFNGILLFKTILVSVIFILIFSTIALKVEKRNYIFDTVLFILMAYSMQTITQSGLRCHFFTFFFFSLYLFILELYRKSNNKKLLYILPAVMLFWANIHGGCVSGLGLLGIYSVGEALNKKSIKHYIIVMLLCLLALFINPYGFDYVKFIFMATTMSRPSVTEWISPFLHPVWQFMIAFKIMYIIYLAILIYSLRKIKSDYTKYILLFICAYLSFRYIKNTPFFIIVSAIFLYQDLYEIINRVLPNKLKTEITNKVAIVCLIIGIIFTGFNTFRNNYSPFFLSQQPVQIVEFIKVNELKGKILATFDMGSYIVYKLFPNNLIYMDGRYEEVYYNETKQKTDDFFNVAENRYEILNDKPNYIIIPANALINDYMKERPDYKLIFSDGNNYLYADNVKESYIMPSTDYKYYLQNAFKTNFSYKDKDLKSFDGKDIIFN